MAPGEVTCRHLIEEVSQIRGPLIFIEPNTTPGTHPPVPTQDHMRLGEIIWAFLWVGGYGWGLALGRNIL